jgi:hypothetical protein
MADQGPSIHKDLLFCKTPGCENTPQNMPVRIARAVIEYHAGEPGYTLRATCDRCNRVSEYAYSEVLERIPQDKRPKPLQQDHFWAFVLIEFKTSRSAEQRTFLSDRLLMQRLYVDPDRSWYGILQSTSSYAPALKLHSYVQGRPWNGYEICRSVVGEGQPKPIPRPDKVVRTSSYAIFVAEQHADNEEEELLCANVCCSNPSCNIIFSTITYEKFKKVAAPAPATMPYYGTGDLPIMTLFCEVCETARIIDEKTFAGLFKGDLSAFKK